MKFNKILLACIFSSSLLASCDSTQMIDSTTSITYTSEIATKEVVNTYTEQTSTYSSLTDMIADVKPSVVDIYSYATTSTAAGSGVVVGESDSGYYIITNHHVIDGASSFEVVAYDEDDNSKTYDATLVGGSPSNDIAVLYVATEDELTLAYFGDSSSLKVGTEVIAIGNPLGILGGTVTRGIVSSTEREVYLSGIGYMKLIQTDAAINSGNSGGALFTDDGSLIGIVNSGYSSYEGLNFAIPANQAKASFDSLINTCTANHLGYVAGEANLGLTLSEATVYSNSNLSGQENIVYAASVDSTSCDAYTSGIKDYSSFTNGRYSSFYAISKINDTEITDSETATKLLQTYKAGDSITFTYKEVKYARSSGFFSMGSTYYYLSDNSYTLTVTLSQYIYSLPTA